jgi:cytoplasmic iron level regulating protein YaaA (DUF328/UPF0246 family)
MALFLLPPSESKYRPGAGPVLELSGRPAPLIDPTRRTLTALVELCRGDPVVAATALGLTEGQLPLVELNAELPSAPTAAARRIYDGVVFDALDLGSMTTSQRRRADRDVWVASALFGVVRLGERIPAYRLSAGTRLPGLGPARGVWRPGLDQVLRPAIAERGVLLDLRSGAYRPLWPVPGELAASCVVGKIWQAHAGGGRTAASHDNKASKGRLTHDLITSGRRLTSPRALLEAALEAGWTADLIAPTGRRPWRLDVTIQR